VKRYKYRWFKFKFGGLICPLGDKAIFEENLLAIPEEKIKSLLIMLTIFTIPKPFRNNINIIQRNAIKSWCLLDPKIEIILFGDEKGVAETAKEFNCRYDPEVAKNEFGTPLVNNVFDKAQKIAKNEILAYVNADIILMKDFVKAIQQINFSKFLMVGRRVNLDVREKIDFNNPFWEKELKERAKKEGKLPSPAAIDYFVFPRNILKEIPPFAVGRTLWDNWFLYKAWISNIPLIDATQVITAIHQNHSYPDKKWKSGIWKGPESKTNQKLAGGFAHALTLRDVDWVLTPSGLRKPKLTFYRIFSFPFRYYEKLPMLKIFLFPGWLTMIFWRKLQNFLA
jgi:hypothetical protein